MPKPKGHNRNQNSHASKVSAQIARDEAREALMQELIPADYTGAPVLPFPIPGGMVRAERGVKFGKDKKAKRKLQPGAWTKALEWALENYATSQVEQTAVIRAIALHQVHKAVMGTFESVKEIAERLDGKATQSVEVQSVEDRTITIVHKTE